MLITLRYFDGCPNWQTADARLREALATDHIHADIIYEAVNTPEEAERLRFTGSPTVLIDGAEPFPVAETSFGLACRVYQTEVGLEGSPSVRQFAAAMSEHADDS